MSRREDQPTGDLAPENDLQSLSAPDGLRRVLDRLKVLQLLEEVRRDFEDWNKAKISAAYEAAGIDNNEYPRWGYALRGWEEVRWSYVTPIRTAQMVRWSVGSGSHISGGSGGELVTVKGMGMVRSISIFAHEWKGPHNSIWFDVNKSADELRAFVGNYLAVRKRIIAVYISP